MVGVLDEAEAGVSAAATNPQDNQAFFPLTTFHYMHPEQLDYWVTLKYDDPKNRLAVVDEVTELLRRRRKVLNEAQDNFLYLRHGHHHAAVGPDYKAGCFC